MRQSAGVASAIVGLTLLGYFVFPGHTYLQQDTQIYVPILEHLWDSGTLTRDILVQRPHVAFTLYDELAVVLRWITGAGFHPILVALHLLTRALGLWGIYLIALSLLEDRARALLVAAVWGLGGAIDGPAVLVTEYEPSPRAFAIPLVFLAIGLMAWRRPMWAGTVAAAGFVLHPPSVLAFWVVYLCVERRWKVWAPLAIAVTVLLLAASAQPGVRESQPFFLRIPAELERLQRLRASYNWVSLWWGTEWWKHLLAAGAVALAWWRLRRLGAFLLGLPAIGLLSVPLSYLLLEKWKWGLVPQVQPARTLLFVTAMAMLLAAIRGCLALKKGRWAESYLWFFVAVVPPLVWSHWWLAAALSGMLVLSARWKWVSVPLMVLCYLAIPYAGQVRNYPPVHTPELGMLAEWARGHTAIDAVFVFPAAGKKPDAGVFRSEALRAVYVDWKGGGQVNYLPELGEEWWKRWSDVMLRPLDFEHYKQLGIDYVVLAPDQSVAGQSPTYRNSRYAVYLVPAKTAQAENLRKADVEVDQPDTAHRATQVGALPEPGPVRDRGGEKGSE